MRSDRAGGAPSSPPSSTGESRVGALRGRVHQLELEQRDGPVASLELAVAELELAWALIDLGESDESKQLCDGIAHRLGGEADSGVRQIVGWALLGRAEAYFVAGDLESGREVLADIRLRFREDSDPGSRGLALRARLREAEALEGEGQRDKAVTLYDEILREAKGADAAIQIPVAKALAAKAETLATLARWGERVGWDEALATYVEFLKRFSDAPEAAIVSCVPGVLEGTAYVQLQIGLYEQALETIARLFAEFPVEQIPGERIADAVLTRTRALMLEDRDEEALVSIDELLDRFWAAAQPPQRMVAVATKATIHLKMGHAKEAVSFYDQALAVNVAGSEEAVRPARARAVLHRAEALVDLNRLDEARRAIERLVVEYDGDPSESVKSVIDDAKAALAALGH